MVIDVIHLGYSKKIGFKTQILEFPFKNQKLRYFEFKLEESYNIQVNNLMLSEFDENMGEFLKSFSFHPRKSLQSSTYLKKYIFYFFFF